jgi:hypothetical protein
VSEPRSFRDRLQGDLDGRYDKLLKVIDDALAATTTHWVNCPHCRKRSQVEVTDTRAAIAAAEFFANQAEGRPGVDARGSEDAVEPIIFERVVYLFDAAEAAKYESTKKERDDE